jgi:hypothetical protein
MLDQKGVTMSQLDLLCGLDPAHGNSLAPTATDAVAAEARARSASWTATVTVDSGDNHDKGEPSLCVGEGA